MTADEVLDIIRAKSGAGDEPFDILALIRKLYPDVDSVIDVCKTLYATKPILINYQMIFNSILDDFICRYEYDNFKKFSVAFPTVTEYDDLQTLASLIYLESTANPTRDYSDFLKNLVKRNLDITKHFSRLEFSRENFLNVIYKVLLDVELEKGSVYPLSDAIDINNVNLIKYLIENGADINRPYNEGTTGDDMIRPYDENTTPLRLAIKDKVKALKDIYHILFGVNPDFIHDIMNIVPDGPDLAAELINSLDNRDKVLDTRSESNGDTPLTHAIKLSNVNLIRTLLTKGADIDTEAVDGNTPLITAIIKYKDTFGSNKELNELFLAADRNRLVRLGENKQVSALSISINERYLNVVKWLLDDVFALTGEISDQDLVISEQDLKLAEEALKEAVTKADKTRSGKILNLIKDRYDARKAVPKKKEPSSKKGGSKTKKGKKHKEVVETALEPGVAVMNPSKVVETIPAPIISPFIIDEVYSCDQLVDTKFLKGEIVVSCYYQGEFNPSVHGLWPNEVINYDNQILIPVENVNKNNQKTDELSLSRDKMMLPHPYNSLYLVAFEDELVGFLAKQWKYHGIFSGVDIDIDKYFETCFKLAKPVIILLLNNREKIFEQVDNGISIKSAVDGIIADSVLQPFVYNSKAYVHEKTGKYCLDLKFNVCALEKDGVYDWKFVDLNCLRKLY
jgi:ankyrin repeat protein